MKKRDGTYLLVFVTIVLLLLIGCDIDGDDDSGGASNRVRIDSALNSSQEVDAATNTSGSFGSASAEIEFQATEAVISVEFDLTVNAGSEITRVHIHRAPAGLNGPIEVSFFDVVTGQNPNPIPVLNGEISLAFELSIDSALADEIASFPEEFYFNVHTDTNPAGELRGQLGNAPENAEVEIPSALSSDQEVGAAANASGSNGSANAEIEIKNGAAVISVEFNLTVNAGNEITRVHIHRAPVGQNGPIEVSFFDVVTGQDSVPIPVVGGVIDLEFELAVDPFLAEEIADSPEAFYFNVHTDANPAGELRGQLDNT